MNIKQRKRLNRIRLLLPFVIIAYVGFLVDSIVDHTREGRMFSSDSYGEDDYSVMQPSSPASEDGGGEALSAKARLIRAYDARNAAFYENASDTTQYIP